MTEKPISLQLGSKLKRFREKAGLTVAALAQAVGQAAPWVDAVEADTQLPDLPQLLALAQALQVGPGALLSPAAGGGRVELVRAADRWKVQPSTDQATLGHYRYEALSYRLTEKLMSPFLIEMTPQQTAEVPLSSHEGEEFLFLLAGEVQVTIGEQKYALRAGDSLYFDSRLQHSIVPVGAQTARLLACIAQDHKEPPGNPIDRAY